MNIFRRKGRKYPIKRDEQGRSARQQAFELFSEWYRPAQVDKEILVPVLLETLFRYFEDWKKQNGRESYSALKKHMKKNPEFNERVIKMLADYFDVLPEQIVHRMQKPWGLMRLAKGELLVNKLRKVQSRIENRLEAALSLINFGEKVSQNSPGQVKQIIWDIIAMKDNTMLIIQKTNGQVVIRKEEYHD
ncbi:hypothetical protein ACFLVX_05440 [Chloroflexota bacterium]